MRARLLSSTIWAAVTGSATSERAQAIAKYLGFKPGHYINARYTIDCPTIKYIPQFFKHPISGNEFLDLSFLIPFSMTSVQEIPSTLLFATTINSGYRIMQFLDRLIPSAIPDRHNVIKLYNSLMPIDYWKEFLHDIQEGSVLRIGIVTDTCTYGLDIPNLRHVVLFDMCPSFENLKQKIGCPGHDGLPAEAITYAPSWVHDLPVNDGEGLGKQAVEDKKRCEKLPDVMRQWYNPTSLLCSRAADMKYNTELFIQHSDCCITCDPSPQESRDLALVQTWVSHFEELVKKNQTHIKPLCTNGTYHPLEKNMKESLLQMLQHWRGQKWATIRGSQKGIPSTVFLPQNILLRIVDRAHLCSDIDRLRVVCDGWNRFGDYGIELLQYLGKIMTGFNKLFNKREAENSESDDVEMATLNLEETAATVASVTITSQSRVRLVLGSNLAASSTTMCMVPIKRYASPPRLMPVKRSRSNKENEYIR